MSIYLIIGGSCAGKSSFVRNSFIRNVRKEDIIERKDLMLLCETPTTILIGTYLVDESSNDIKVLRRVGSDRILRSDINNVVEQVERLIPLGKDIVLEGDRITSHAIFDGLLTLGVEIHLFLIECSIESTIKRNEANNSTCNPSTLKRVRTKANNIFSEYKDRMNGVIINTDKFTYPNDFARYDIHNYREYDIASSYGLFEFEN